MIKKIFLVSLFLLPLSILKAHHYKGLPHNSYFENYPQTPILEFLHEDDSKEIFLTVYNFQGISLDQVQDNDMIRLYIFLYDVSNNTPYTTPTRFEIYSRGVLIHTEEELEPQEESIFSIHKSIVNQDDLALKVYFKMNGQVEPITLPFRITKTFLQKYGILVGIFSFFFFVGILKKYIIKEE